MKYIYGINELYVLTFPYTMNKVTYTLLEDEANREINVSKDIAIVTTLQNENHTLLRQLTNNNILFYQTTNEELATTINKIHKEYVLVITSPAIIVNDLDKDFLNLFNASGDKFIFGGTFNNPLGINYLGCNELYMGVNQYLDSSIMFGYTKDVKKYYSKYLYDKDSKLMSDITTLVKNYNSNRYWNCYIDSYNNFFCCVDFENVQIREDEKYRYIELINNEERRLF